MSDNISPSMDTGHEQYPVCIQEAIDAAYINLAVECTQIRFYYINCQGAEREFFSRFFGSFSLLIHLTISQKEVDKNLDIVKKCRDWLDANMDWDRSDKEKTIKAHALNGVSLAIDYSSLLNEVGVCVLRR